MALLRAIGSALEARASIPKWKHRWIPEWTPGLRAEQSLSRLQRDFSFVHRPVLLFG
jgi:hypothetical protein